MSLGLIQWSVIKRLELKEKDLSRVDVKVRRLSPVVIKKYIEHEKDVSATIKKNSSKLLQIPMSKIMQAGVLFMKFLFLTKKIPWQL